MVLCNGHNLSDVGPVDVILSFHPFIVCIRKEYISVGTLVVSLLWCYCTWLGPLLGKIHLRDYSKINEITQTSFMLAR
jgi:hypothetical protein